MFCTAWPAAPFTRLSMALTTTATVSAAAGKLGGYMFFNPNAATAYVQVFDTASAPTLGTTAPTLVIPVPGGADHWRG